MVDPKRKDEYNVNIFLRQSKLNLKVNSLLNKKVIKLQWNYLEYNKKNSNKWKFNRLK
jgi:hypothetical protein